MCHAMPPATLPATAALAILAALIALPAVRCRGSGEAEMNELITGVVYNKLQNLTGIFNKEIGADLLYCIKDRDKDWNEAFNFSSDLTFLNNCIKKTKGDISYRLCTAAEIKFYFKSLSDNMGKKNFLRPNKNCDLDSWVAGCEPGWACSVGQNQKVELKDNKEMPQRKTDCQPCCEGFFCPRGITCMIACPLGAYCPLATLNKTTGICDPHYCRKGSTSMQRCFNKSSCKERSANQDITLFGLLLIVALGLLLLIIYNFSGQMLTSREQEQAKSREAAARSARETAQARERWKSAKDVAKKHAVGLQTQLSRTFSRKKSTKSDILKGIANKFGSNDASLPPMGPSSSSTSTGKKEPSNLTKMMRSLEENPDSNEGFNFSIGDKNLKKNAPKGRQMHTRSQIFRYAYGQIEKEKAMQQQNNNLTFSGLISMATDTEIRTRPIIEVAFKDLTLTLKGKNKTLLRSVTGKLMPGRVTAVMGPSGAGKTTFLSALAGKVKGCEMSGLILINGVVESMSSYKKIIGFVPQDDIVHGNLTVEENLWFSARCRLPADMSKADKVLVVERVIESLGLQAVRDSLVGTVEKRGISGGQKKRVNVGLEMVMEPSLLILDEPTSGLDSSSSQLLLKALRREALEGVNVTLVVHQPSYTLFKMFDDLVLLAKGGLTAYHGPVKKVEEYFSGLGINVPDRVNPPDYFIDILEGIVKPSTSSGINVKQLPLKWMQHNGYPVPPDMLHNLMGSDTSYGGANATTDAAGTGSEASSVAGEIWQDVECITEQKQDNIEQNYSQLKDLSNRITPGVLRQYRYFLGRVGKQRLREARIQFVDLLILCLAGICLGTLAKVSDETFGSLGYTYTVIAVSLLCKIGALRSFSLDKLHYWRERASGMSSLAYFLSKDTIDHFNTVIKPIVYLSMFYFFNNPRSSITDNYIILVSLVYSVTGIAYWFAIFFQPGSAQLWSVLLPVVLTLIATQENGSTAKYLSNFCYTKWALEAFVISNAERYPGVWLITRCGSLIQNGYNIGEWGLCIAILILYGIAFRLIAFFCLITFQKK